MHLLQYNIHRILWSKYYSIISLLLISLIYLSFNNHQFTYCMMEETGVTNLPIESQPNNSHVRTNLDMLIHRQINTYIDLAEIVEKQKIEIESLTLRCEQAIEEKNYLIEHTRRHGRSLIDQRLIYNQQQQQLLRCIGILQEQNNNKTLIINAKNQEFNTLLGFTGFYVITTCILALNLAVSLKTLNHYLGITPYTVFMQTGKIFLLQPLGLIWLCK